MAKGCTRCIICLIGDILLAVTVWVISIIIRKTAVPYHRGFFCDDQSLMHPYKDSTISASLMYSVGIILPCVFIMLTELLIEYSSLKSCVKENRSVVEDVFVRMFKVLLAFCFGGGVTNLLTNIAKYSIGRLRPHFIAVCDPNWNIAVCSIGALPKYVTIEVCKGTDKELLIEARLSFVSGHTSMSMYFMVFLVIYMQRRFAWKGMQLLRPTLQILFFSLALYTGLTRISDYKHHWSDVFAGAVLGAAVAMFSIFKTCGLYTISYSPTKDSQQSKCDRDKLEKKKTSKSNLRKQVDPADNTFYEVTDM